MMKIDVNHPKTMMFHSLAKQVSNAYEFFELIKKIGYESDSNKQKGDPTEGFAYVHFCLSGEFSKVDYCPEGERGFDLNLIREGKKEACQAKFRTSETITSDELATTGDQAWHKGHSGIYVFGNLHELPPLWKSNKKACLIGLTELDNVNWQEYIDASAGIVKPLVPKTLRGEQPRIYQEICDFKLDRGVVYVPAGGGKTFLETLTFINKWDKKNPILVCAPFIRLVNQHYREITKECRARGICFKSIVVNSGGKIGKDENDTDMTKEDQEGVIATTDPKEITRFLKKGTKTLRIVFCTYASLDVLAKASKTSKFSVGIMDEAHNLTGHVSKAWTRIHSNKFINIKNRYYFTATGKSYSGERDDIFGMPVRNRPEFKSKAFGSIISYTSIRQAINAKMINDYRIILPHISSKKLAQYWSQLKDNVFLDVPNDENGNLDLTMQEVFIKTVIYKSFELKTDISRFIGLFNRVDNAKRMAQFLKQEDVITKEFGFVLNNVDWVAGQGKKNKRDFDTAIRNFSNSSERAFLCATQVLNEGIDIKGRNDERANAVIFCDPKRTKYGIQQGGGRGMRFDPNSKTGLSYIVLPLLEGENEDGEYGVIYNISMDCALDVVKSMRADDEQLHDEMRNFTIGRRMSKGSYKKTSGILEMPDIVKESFDSEAFVDAIELRIIGPSFNSSTHLVSKASYEKHIEFAKRFKNAIAYAKAKKPLDFYSTIQRLQQEYPKKDVFSDVGWFNIHGERASYEEHIKECKKYKSASEYNCAKKSSKFYAKFGGIRRNWPNKDLMKDIGWEISIFSNSLKKDLTYEKQLKECKKHKNAYSYDKSKKDPIFYNTCTAVMNRWKDKDLFKDCGWYNPMKQERATYEEHVNLCKKYKSKNAYDSDKNKNKIYFSSARNIMRVWPDKNLYKDCGWVVSNKFSKYT